MKPFFLLLASIIATGISAQDDRIAYVPRANLARTADTEAIVLEGTDEHGIYHLEVPAGTTRIDVLNAHGDHVEPQPPIDRGTIDIRGLKASTYTIRAHRATGISVRRFALLGRGASLWAIDAEPVR